MAKRVVQTNKQLAAERQIHAAIAHFRAGGFECAITLCHAAEGQLPEPNESIDLLEEIQSLHDERGGVSDAHCEFRESSGAFCVSSIAGLVLRACPPECGRWL